MGNQGVQSFYLLLALLLVPALLSAQQAIRVSGRITGMSGTGEIEALPYTNVTILTAKDSIFIKGTASDLDGNFRLSLTPKSRKDYLLKISYIGMKSVYLPINKNKATANLGDICLTEGMELAEVTVTAPLKAIEQVGDTTVINAAAYHTPEGSYLEELVKRIPGLEYERKTKSLTYNGLPINEININGESYFSGNNSMALENLPVEVISKIKVYNKKSELEKITGVDTGKENFVLDLQTPAKFDGMLTGNGEAGQGNHRKKDYTFIGNYFKQSGENATVIARSSNKNQQTDYKDNIQSNIATNFTKKFGKKFILTGNAIYNNHKQGDRSTAYNEQYLTTGNQYQASVGNSINGNKMASAILGIRWQIDKKTWLNLNGSFNYNRNENTNDSRQATFNANPNVDAKDPFANIADIPHDTRLNENTLQTLALGKRHQYEVNADVTRLLNEKGTSVSLTLRYNGGNGNNDNFTFSSTTYYQLQTTTGTDSLLYRNQYNTSPSRDRNQSSGLLLTHPLAKKLRLQLSYNLNYTKQNSDRNSYDLSRLTEEGSKSIGFLPDGYETGYTDSLSNRSHSRTLSHEVAVRMNYNDKTWDINTGISIQQEKRSIDQKNGLLRADTAMRNFNVQPSVKIVWKNKKTRIQFMYNGSTRQPLLSSLLSLTDNSNPLNISRGNPDLKPAYNQIIRLDAQNTDKGIFANLNWRNEFNSQIRGVAYNPTTGGRETYPVNINGNWNADFRLRYQKRIKLFNLSASTGAGYGQNVTLINEGQNANPGRSVTRTDRYNGSLRLAYLPKWGNVELNADWRYQHAANSLHETEIYTRNYTFGLDAYTELPGNLRLKTDAAYSFRNGTNIEKRADDQILWNAGISWRFLKKKQAEISAYWADILSDKKDFNRSTTANGFSETHTRQTGSYFIVSLKYNFNQSLHK